MYLTRGTAPETETKMNNSDQRQLTVRSLVLGVIGSVIITMSSMYIALRLSSLPWPIIFVALASMFSLKLMGNTNLNEINVTHTAMSAGAMVSGGLAFTIPGIWIMMPEEKPSFPVILAISMGGTILGLIFTVFIRKYFVEEKKLEYPMGQAAADTLRAGDEGGQKAKTLFTALGITGVFTIFRDWLHKIPAAWMSKKAAAYGSSAGIWFSPMMIGVGFLLGPSLIFIWFLGAVLGDFGILFLGVKGGFLTTPEAVSLKASLGIGIMVGCGLGIIIKGILPKLKDIFTASFSAQGGNDIALRPSLTGVIVIAIAAIFATVCNMGIGASVITIVGAWLAVSMSSESVGTTGVNPMEIFGMLVMLCARAITSVGSVESFYIAAVVAVAAGLVGDVMNDFKVGYSFGTSPKDQWIAEAVGGMAGAVAAAAALMAVYTAYGPEAIGGPEFPAAQAAAVASMVSGISNLPAFIVGIVAATVLYCMGLPVMTLGLGVYLPAYLSLTASLGGLIRFFVDRRGKKVPESKAVEKGTLIASGCLGGEAVVGVVISIILAIQTIR